MLTTILKESTKEAHALTEKTMGSKRIFSPDYTFDEYHNHLQHLYKAHLITEKILDDNELIQYFLSKNRSSHLLTDLQNINNQFIPFKNIQLKNGCNYSFESKLGILYVITGSLLGGKFISKKIEFHLVDFKLPKQHFYSTTETDLLAKWNDWCSKINAIPLNQNQIDEVINGALIGFDLFIHPENYAEFE